MQAPPPGLSFDDQYAFRPTGSATAALISTIGTITKLLRSGKTVVLLSLDFSKAFDRVRHGSLLENFAQLEIPDEVYNWISSYLEGREHVTKNRGSTSERRKINLSVVQGSSIGPASYYVAESDLKPKRESFMMDKFADDVDLITTIEHYSEIKDEVEHIAEWADKNNLVLNRAKTKETIFCSSISVQLPPPLDGRERVSSFRKLDVIVQNKLSMKDHVDVVLRDCANQIYGLNILRAHGMQASGLQLVFNPQTPKLKIHLRTPKRGWIPPLDFCLSVRIFRKYFSWACFRGQGIQPW